MRSSAKPPRRHCARRLLAAVLPPLALGGCALGPAPAPAPIVAPQPVLVLHHFNDWHGRLEPFVRGGEEVGGAARFASLLAARREVAAALGADTLLLVAGDVLQGTAMSTAFRGEADFTLLNLLGVDVMCLGNHEFDFGLPVLEERRRQAAFPLLAANVSWRDGRPFADPWVILETPGHGLRVGVLGVVTEDTPVTTHPANVTELRFEDPVAAALRELPALRSQVDLLVVLSHADHEVELELARLPGVDLVVGGHDHLLVAQGAEATGGAPLVQALEWGEYLGEVVVARRDGALRVAETRQFRTTSEISPDPEVAARVADYRQRLDGELARQVGVAAVRLEGDRAAVRRHETSFGNLVADAVRALAGAEVAVINGGTIRTSIEAGPFTLEDLLQALPFENEVVVVRLTGAELRGMLERSAAMTVHGPEGSFLQVSGIRMRIAGAHARDIEVAGAPLDDQRVYRVAMSDFLAFGGDGHGAAEGKPMERTGYLLNDAVLRWVEDRGVVAPVVDGRIERVEEQTGAEPERDAA
jgi:5'-nucleotidase / UDP-sugar diphosphatase